MLQSMRKKNSAIRIEKSPSKNKRNPCGVLPYYLINGWDGFEGNAMVGSMGGLRDVGGTQKCWNGGGWRQQSKSMAEWVGAHARPSGMKWRVEGHHISSFCAHFHFVPPPITSHLFIPHLHDTVPGVSPIYRWLITNCRVLRKKRKKKYANNGQKPCPTSQLNSMLGQNSL